MESQLVIFICSHRNVTIPLSVSLDQLRLAYLQGQLPFNYSIAWVSGDALISRARSIACTRFLADSTSPFMLFVDDDISFTPQDVTKIYQHLASGQYDLIGGIYPVRGADQLSSYGWNGRLDITGNVEEIEFLATGFMGISRRLLDRMIKELPLTIHNPNDWARCYPFFEAKGVASEERERGGDPIYISEDWDFVQKARKLGIKAYADTAVQVGHLREDMFTVDHVRQKQSQLAMNKQVWSGFQKHIELMQKVDTDLTEFLKIPLVALQNRLKLAQAELAQQWEKRQGKAEEFYKDNETYLFDLATFNKDLVNYFQNRIFQLANIRGIKILDIGCGIGTAVFSLAEYENDVTGWDINQKVIDFCNWKKVKYNLGGSFTTEKPDYSQYDLIIAVDVLEHIEDLKGFLADLGSKMKYGAKFYHSDYFPRDKMWPMHFEENKEKLSEWLKESGMAEWDERWAIKS